jgi:iron complex transport system substrate-binding protein
MRPRTPDHSPRWGGLQAAAGLQPGQPLGMFEPGLKARRKLKLAPRRRSWLMLFSLLLLGASLRAAGPPQRIISTAPSLTEMLFALGLGDRVVGVTTYCFYPPEARRKPKIGTYLKPDLEMLLHLKPDLVVAMQHYTDLKARLAPFGIPILEVSNEMLAGVSESLLIIGRASGVEERAAEQVGALRRELEAVRARVQSRPMRRVMFVVGRTPGTVRDLVAAGGSTFLNELIELAGGVNIFGEAGVAYPKVSIEEVLARRPEVIIDRGDMAETNRVTSEHEKAVVQLWSRWSILPAVQARRVHAVASDAFVIPGPRVVEAARALARMIHPEAGW